MQIETLEDKKSKSGFKSPYRALFQPLQLKNLILKNRILSTSHAPAYAEGGMPGERYQLYHEEKAKGGLAMTMFGGASTFTADSPPSFGQIYVGSDDVIPYFKAFADRIHRHDVALMCQISHVGRRTVGSRGAWLPAISSSALKEPAHGTYPKAMEPSDFRRVAESYGAAARRCRDGGLDGCELIVTGHIIGQFWSPLINKRRDEHGGSLDNRLRFTFQILETIRKAVGPDFIVGIRMSVDEFIEGGVRLDEATEIARRLDASGLVDFLNINGSAGWTKAGLASSVPGMAYPGSLYVHLAAHIRKAVSLPIFHAARVGDLASANSAVAEGMVDMIGMTRAHIADPYLIRKHLDGREEQTRLCVGASYCIDRIYVGNDALCIQNAATGREATMPHVIEPTKRAKRKIVVVGAGPGGLEAARVSAERGHEVVLFEAAAEVGGQVLLAARASWRRHLIGVTRWLNDEITRLGVTVHLNTYADSNDILAQKPDVVIIATGGVPNMELVEGGELAASVWDVLSSQVKPKEDVLVFDDRSDHQALSACEFLAEAGSKVELVTTDRNVGYGVGATNAIVHLKNLYKLGVQMTPDRRLVSIARDGNRLRAVLRNEYTGEEEVRVASQVVLECGTSPSDELYLELRDQSRNEGEYDLTAFGEGRLETIVRDPDASFELYRVGDAISSRNIHAAIYDSLRLCKDM